MLFAVPYPASIQLAATDDGSVWAGVGPARGAPRTAVQVSRAVASQELGGLYRWRQGRWRRFGRGEGLDDAAVLALLAAPAGGGLWVATASGLYLCRGDRCEVLPGGVPPGQVRALTIDDDGSLLIGGTDGVWRLRNGRLAPTAFRDRVDAIARHPGGGLWVGGPGLVARLEGEHMTTRITEADGLPGSHVAALLVDRQGAAWIGTDRGLLEVSTRGRRLLSTATGLADDSIRALLEDELGAIWIGTETGGIARLKPRLGQSFQPGRDVPGQPAAVLAARDGTIWLSTSEAIARWDENKGRFDIVLAGAQAGGARFQSLASGPDGALWVATAGQGVLRLHRGEPCRLSVGQGLPHDSPLALLSDTAGYLWLGWEDGTLTRVKLPAGSCPVRLSPGSLTTYGPADGLCGGAVVSGLERASGARIFGAERGIILFSGAEKARCLSGPEGLGHPVEALLEDTTGELWVGARQDGGLALVRDRVRIFRDAEGLTCDTVHELVEDGHGRLWVICAGGVSLVARAAVLAMAAEKLDQLPAQPLSVLDGLTSERTRPGIHPLAARGPDGSIWIVTTAGLTRFFPPPARPPGLSIARPVLRRVSLDGEDLVAGGAIVGVGDRFDLSFEISAPLFDFPARPIFRHRLEGFEEAWQRLDPLAQAHYRRLSPGRYLLRVQMTDSVQAWGGRELIVPLDLRAPWHRRPAVMLAGLFALSVLAVGVHRWRLWRVTARFSAIQEERARVARELHDVLGQVFASLGFHLEALSRVLREPPEPAREILAHTRAVLSSARISVRNALWDLRSPSRPPDRTLAEALRVLVEQERSCSPAGAPEISLRVAGAALRLPAATITQVLEIAREAIRNAREHAGARSIVISLSQSAMTTRLEVTDDGRGIAVDLAALPERGHFGIVGMFERARQIGGRLSIRPRTAGGTEIALEIEHRGPSPAGPT